MRPSHLRPLGNVLAPAPARFHLNWDVLLDGRSHDLVQGEDFENHKTLRASACKAAQRRDKTAHVHLIEKRGRMILRITASENP